MHNGHLLAWINNENKPVDVKSPGFKEYEAKLVAYGVQLYEEAMKNKSPYCFTNTYPVKKSSGFF